MPFPIVLLQNRYKRPQSKFELVSPISLRVPLIDTPYSIIDTLINGDISDDNIQPLAIFVIGHL